MPRALTSRDLLLASIAAFLLFTAGACSTGSDSGEAGGDDPPAAGAIDGSEVDGGEVPSDSDAGDAPYWGSEVEMRCVEEHPTTAGLGDVNLQDNPSEANLVAMVEVFLECIEDPPSSPGIRAIVSGDLESATRGLRISDAEGACLVGDILQHADDPALALVGGGGESDAMVMADAMEACLTAENLAVATGAEGTGPQDYGDDPRLDSIWDDCDAGDLRACDLLFFQVSVGSGYERHAETCGGTRSDVTTFCSDDTDVDDGWLLHPDGAAALTLVADCEAGDLTACDLLYQIAPFGSDLENWGRTCAERIPGAALPDCRTRLG